MRLINLLFSAAHFFVIFIVLFLGVFFLSLPYAYPVCAAIVSLLTESPEVFTKIGSITLGCGVLLLLAFFLLNRRYYLQLEMDGSRVLIEEKIIQDYVCGYWKQRFPDYAVPTDVIVKGNQRLEIIANLPLKYTQNKEELFEQIESELGLILGRRLGYKKPFYLTVTM